MKKLVIILLMVLAAIILIFGLKLFSLTSDYNAKLKAQVPHLQIVTPEPIIADSAFKVSAFARLSDDSTQSVPFIRILKKEDGTYISGKAMKMAYLTDYTMMAPKAAGSYILIYKNSIGEDITSLSFEVTQA